MSEKPTERKPQDADKYVLRFPDGMRDRIAELAKQNNRSMNAEIVARLEQSMKSSTTAALEEFLKNDDFAQAFADRVEKNLTMRGLSIVPTASVPQKDKLPNG